MASNERKMDRKAVFEPYDMDTGIGTNNSGALLFSPYLEDTDRVSSVISGEGGSEAPVFNAQDSVFWCNLRDAFRGDLVTMYRGLRSDGTWSYDKFIQMFEEHQSKWPEAIFNEDAWTKYVIPLINSVTTDDNGNFIRTDRYLPMLLGKKAEQRKWWIYERLRYYDSKCNTGSATANVINMRFFNDGVLTLKAAIPLYLAVSFGGGTTPMIQRVKTANTPAEFQYIAPSGVTEMETWVYSADLITDVGDLSVFYPNECDFSKAVRLKRLKIGDSTEGYSNTNLVTLDVQNSRLLEYIDCRNCPRLGITINLENSTRLSEAYFDNTSITGVDLADGGVIKVLHLPETITTLSLLNLSKLRELEIPSYANISRLMLANISQDILNPVNVLKAIHSNSQVNIQGLSLELEDGDAISEFFDLLDTMTGVTRERGANGDWLYHDEERAVINGTIHTDTLTGNQIAEFNQRYPYIRVSATHTTSYLRYWNSDGTQLLYTETITDGGNGVNAPTATKTSTAQYSFTHNGWSKTKDQETNELNALTNVLADRDVYATFSKTVRTYTVYWKNANGATIETDTDVPYGTTPTYNSATPTQDGQTSTGWTPAVGPITGDTTYTAVYKPIYTATFVRASADGGGTLYSVKVVEGQTPSYSGDTPTTTKGSAEERPFTGWKPPLGPITANTTYTAQFKSPLEVPTAKTANGAYGVEWNYANSATTLTRSGLATGIADPSPATTITGTGSSPFDDVSPWKDIKRYNIIDGEVSYSSDDAGYSETDYDTVVWIPTFYYTAYKDTENNKWIWAISPTKLEGFAKHPGSGRYVGRFHTTGDSNEVTTKGGLAPFAGVTRANYRSWSHNKGEKWYMIDLAAWSAIQILYLVEFANFHSQNTLGKGQNTGSIGLTGSTSGAVYHTIKGDKTSTSCNMYRWIENPFSQVIDWCDGFVASSRKAYAGFESGTYTDNTSSLEETGITLPSSQYITGFGYSEQAPFAFIPDAASGGSANTYVPDYVSSDTSVRILGVGGGYYDSDSYGFFCFNAVNSASRAGAGIGSRLQYIP